MSYQSSHDSVNTSPEKTLDLKLGINLNVIELSIPYYLQDYESHFNWFKIIPLKINEIENGLIAMEEKFIVDSNEIDSLLKSSRGIKLISKKSTQIFFLIETKKFYLAKSNLEEGKMLVKTCLENHTFSEEYVDGFIYVFDGLDIYLKVKAGWNSGHRVNPPELSKVPPKGKVAIWIMKDFFLEDCRRAAVDRPDYMEKIIEVEPYIIKWHFHLYIALRNNRKLKPRPTPYGHERIILDDPLSLSYVCSYLAEILMTELEMEQDSNSYVIPIRFGNFTFTSPKDIVSTILEKTMNLLAMNCNIDEVYLTLAEVHLYKLPQRFQKKEIALACLKRVFKINPNSQKGHYQMGIFHFKRGNNMQAMIHLRHTIKNDNLINIGAGFALLQILMSDPITNSVEINSILQLFMGNPKLSMVWDNRCLRTLHYLKGCFQFMLENKEEEAITSWIIAHDNDSSKWSYYFQNLPHQNEVFGWPTIKLNLPNVSKTLKHAAYIEQTDYKEILLKICSEVDNVIKTQWELGNLKTSLTVNK